MNRRFLLMVKKPTALGFDQYDHIAYVAEYEDRYYAGYSDTQLRRKFHDRCKRIEQGNPTRSIKMEYIHDTRNVVDADNRLRVFSAVFGSTNPDNNLLFLALSKSKLEEDVIAHVRNFQDQNITGTDKIETYIEACQLLCNVLGASLDESEHMLP